MSRKSKELVKRLLAVALTLVLVLGMLPLTSVSAYAEGETLEPLEESPTPEVTPPSVVSPSPEVTTSPEVTPPPESPSPSPELKELKVTLDTVGDFPYDGESHDLIKELKVSPKVDYTVEYKLTYTDTDNRESAPVEFGKAEDVKATDAGEYKITATVTAEGFAVTEVQKTVTVEKAGWAITFTDDADKVIEAGSTIEGTVSDGSCVKTVYLKEKYENIKFTLSEDEATAEVAAPVYSSENGELVLTFTVAGSYSLKASLDADNNHNKTEATLSFAISADSTVSSAISANDVTAVLNIKDTFKISVPFQLNGGACGSVSGKIVDTDQNIIDLFTVKTSDLWSWKDGTIELTAKADDLAESMNDGEISFTLEITKEKWRGSPKAATKVTVKIIFASFEFSADDLAITGGIYENGWYRADAEGKTPSVTIINESLGGYTLSASAGGDYAESCELPEGMDPVVYVCNSAGDVARIALDAKADYNAPVTIIEEVPGLKSTWQQILKNITFGAAEPKDEYKVKLSASDKNAVASVHVVVKTISLAQIQEDIKAAEPVKESYVDEEAYKAAHDAWEAEHGEDDPEPQPTDYIDESAYEEAHDDWMNGKVNIDFTFADEDKREYTIGKGLTLNEDGTYTTEDLRVEANTDQICQIDFWAVDEAGNVERVRHTGNYDEVAGKVYDFLLIDNNAPEITLFFNGEELDGNTFYFNKDVTISAEVEEEYYDVIDKDGLLTVLINEKSNADEDRDQKVECEALTVDENSVETYTIKATCTDRSGNSKTIEKTLIIDKAAPAPTAALVEDYNGYLDEPDELDEPDTNRRYFNTEIDFVIDAGDDNPGKTVEITTDDAEKADTVELDKGKGAYTLDTEGEHSFTLAHTDLAGNTGNGESEHIYVIDKTNPTVNVNLRAPANMKGATRYYNGPISGTIQIVEKNFAEKLISVAVNDIGRKADFTKGSEDTYNGSVYITGDGNYKLSVNGKDKAGNSMTGYASDNLIIDTKIEAPVISGVASGKAYTDKNITVTVTGDDTNLDEISVKITRVTKDTSETVFTTSGKDRTVSFSIPDDQSADGIYTVEASIRDKATNKASAVPVTFTVNRYGSVYEFVSGIDEVNGKHVQAVEKDLVIREYSATKLKTPLDSNVQITINGKPVSAAVVNAEEKHENGGWYEYTYTVAASSFAEDGYYKLEVSSTDSENGKVSGTAKYADMGLAFFKDGTKPQLESILGMEKPTYNENEHGIDFNVYDAIGLASVKVYVDGKEVLTQTEFEDANTFNGSLLLNEMSSKQHVRFVVEDLAGNVTDTDDEIEAFAPAYEFVPDITVSTNFFVRWYAQPGLFWGSIGGGVALIALIVFLISRKKKTAKAE